MNLNRSSKIALIALLVAQGVWAGAQTNSADAAVDYSSFSKFIADRNIFDPTRVPHVPFQPRPVTTVPPVTRVPDSFSLVGIIGYGEGRLAGVYAFFDGSSLEYRKAAQVNDSIANFKISAIGPDSVTLLSGTNTTILRIGEQMHDTGGGHWLSDSESSARYNNVNGRNSGRNGFARGNRRRNNNYNNNYNSGNFTRNRNNFATSDNSQNSPPDDASMNVPPGADMNGPDDTSAPDDTPASNDTPMPDNTPAPDTDTSTAPASQPELQPTGQGQ
jgi:hypothetical protein